MSGPDGAVAAGANIDVLHAPVSPGTLEWMEEEEGIYRGEVLAIIGALADIYADTSRIRSLLEDDEDGDEAEEVDT